LSLQSCVHCGKETGEGELYCPDCQAFFGAKKPRRFWIFSILFSVLLLSLTGLLLWHGGISFGSLSLDSILGKPAAVVNGEPIPISDLRERVKAIRSMLERQNGRNIFSGEEGRALLGNLEQQVLDGMVEEKLVAQEARKLKIQITDEMVQQELQKIGKEIYGSRDKFQARLREDGVTEEELQEHIGNLLLYKAVRAAKSSPGLNSEASFNGWLTQARQNAELAIYYSGAGASSSSTLLGGCCDTSGSGNAGPSGPVDAKTEKEAQTLALEAYRKINPSDRGVTAKVTDYGCHLQVDIQKEGRVVKSYIYQGGKVFENS
jgi:hypothetical protein